MSGGTLGAPVPATAVWSLSFESRHFSFEAFGLDPLKPRAAFNAGIDEHARQTGAPADWVEEAKANAESAVFELGACYRDRILLTGAAS